ncbi:hypothetical protein DM860_017109 [Cuscuta australis]|uniref:BHLH domain-containing protein n=1 Tax=Cuscuta australis TaxID=267555 RepID=A0A328DQW9_9ASTE|nr:hypothetical protein DM860_017109 [Cuscuta australis]
MVHAIGVIGRQNGVSHDNPYCPSKKKSKEAAHRHAKAEGERRQRINSHISTLRKLFPHLPKKDKPRVLTEAVKQLKELRKMAAAAVMEETGFPESSLFLPGENDEVAVAPFTGGEEGGELLSAMKATICCDDRPGLIQELSDAIHSANGKVAMAEMATLGGRTKVDVVVRWHDSELGGGTGDGEKNIGSSLRRALKAVVENRSLGYSMLSRHGLQFNARFGTEVGLRNDRPTAHYYKIN